MGNPRAPCDRVCRASRRMANEADLAVGAGHCYACRLLRPDQCPLRAQPSMLRHLLDGNPLAAISALVAQPFVRSVVYWTLLVWLGFVVVVEVDELFSYYTDMETYRRVYQFPGRDLATIWILHC